MGIKKSAYLKLEWMLVYKEKYKNLNRPLSLVTFLEGRFIFFIILKILGLLNSNGPILQYMMDS
jgi:hypothetical protein